MKKISSRKGFTIVELIIVIAVIGVLAAILIPTFSTVIKKANYADRQSMVKNLNTAVVSETEGMEAQTALTMEQAMDAIVSAGYSESMLKSGKKDFDIVWIGKVGTTILNRFAVVTLDPDTQKVDELVYPQEAIKAVAAMPTAWVNASNLQSVSAVRMTSISSCDWAGTARITLTQDESILTGKTLEGAWSIDLNGHTLTLGGLDANLMVSGGSLTINDTKGTGKIISSGATIRVVRNGSLTVNGGELTTTSNRRPVLQAGDSALKTESASLITINGGNITAPNLTPSASYGLAAVVVRCPGAQLDMYNGSISCGYGYGISGNGSAGQGETKINIYGGTITAEAAPAIYHPQSGEMNISGGVIKTVYTGKISADAPESICDAIHVKSGTINISGGIISTDTPARDELDVSFSNGSEPVGAALGIVSNDDYAGQINVNISGGKFISANGYAFSQILSPGNTSSVISIHITGGSFNGNNAHDIYVTDMSQVDIVIENVTANVTRHTV